MFRVLFDPKYVHKTNSSLVQCGLNGNSSSDAKVPAKSSQSGVFLASFPNLFGLAVYSPLIDDQQVSVRGLLFLKAVLDRYPSLNVAN